MSSLLRGGHRTLPWSVPAWSRLAWALLWTTIPGAAEWAPLALAQDARPLLWEVRGAHGTAFLFGSIHFGYPDLYPLAPAIEETFDAADALVVEVDMLSLEPSEISDAVALHGLLDGGVVLDDLLDAPTRGMLDAALSRYQVPREHLQGHKPWLVALTLTALELTRAGFSEVHGVDRYFMRRAQPSKPVLELETLASQLEIFDQLSTSEQVALLGLTLSDLDHGPGFFADALGAWARGDAAGIDSLLNRSLSAAPHGSRLRQLLIEQRNRQMAARVAALMEEGGRYFVVVGAGHLVGRENLVDLLGAMGYSVRVR